MLAAGGRKVFHRQGIKGTKCHRMAVNEQKAGLIGSHLPHIRQHNGHGDTPPNPTVLSRPFHRKGTPIRNCANPCASISNSQRRSLLIAPVAQLAEATDSKPVQCGFDSHRGHFFLFLFLLYPQMTTDYLLRGVTTFFLYSFPSLTMLLVTLLSVLPLPHAVGRRRRQ